MKPLVVISLAPEVSKLSRADYLRLDVACTSLPLTDPSNKHSFLCKTCFSMRNVTHVSISRGKLASARRHQVKLCP
jgi:hypothetical protein